MCKELLLASIFMSVVAVHIASAFSGGDGSPGNPFQISDCQELQDMQTDLSASYVLVNDIDCTGFDAGDGKGFLPVGPFSGTFDGQGLTITNLLVDRATTDFVGLFSTTEVSASVTDVDIADASVTGNHYAGGLVGVNTGGITNSSASGSVVAMGNYSGSRAGGLVGQNTGSIQSCIGSTNRRSDRPPRGGVVIVAGERLGRW